jgi:hypothetical protein
VLETDALETALDLLGRLLAEQGIEYEIVVIGGSALLLLGLIQRPTKDLDVLALVRDDHYTIAKPFPADLDEAVRDVALTLGLASDWLNGEATLQLETGLPAGFEERVETRHYETLTVHVASRFDLIHFKLFAAVDNWPLQGKHADDLRRLRPTAEELRAAAGWVRPQDIGEGFQQLVAAALSAFGVSDA